MAEPIGRNTNKGGPFIEVTEICRLTLKYSCGRMPFPDDFLWGVSLSGFQFEMGDPENRSLDPNTDWFLWVHDRKNIEAGIVSGDLPENGVDYWFRYPEDHKLARDLGLNVYRLGVEWSRIFPSSTRGIEVDVHRAPDGRIKGVGLDEGDLERLDELADASALGHYRKIISDLLEGGFRVVLCLNHFTLPAWIHDPIKSRDTKLRSGPRGWVDESTVVEFAKYSAYIAWKMGDLVDWWATFNEPMVVAEMGYLMPEAGFPPGLNNYRAFLRASANIALAHSIAFDLVKKFDRRRADQGSPSPAQVGLIHNVIPVSPLVPERDREAVDFFNHMHNVFFLEAAKSGWLDENMNGERDRGEVKGYLGNRLDWLGVNYYTRAVISSRKSLLARVFAGIKALPKLEEGYGFACKPNSTSRDGRLTSDFGWEVYPEGLRDAISIAHEYSDYVMITENGIADSKDALRPYFLIEHLKILENMLDEGYRVRGYLHWALTDNYEWAHGFRMKFGLFSVDLGTKERIKRKSADVYRKIIEVGTVPEIPKTET